VLLTQDRFTPKLAMLWELCNAEGLDFAAAESLMMLVEGASAQQIVGVLTKYTESLDAVRTCFLNCLFCFVAWLQSVIGKAASPKAQREQQLHRRHACVFCALLQAANELLQLSAVVDDDGTRFSGLSLDEKQRFHRASHMEQQTFNTKRNRGQKIEGFFAYQCRAIPESGASGNRMADVVRQHAPPAAMPLLGPANQGTRMTICAQLLSGCPSQSDALTLHRWAGGVHYARTANRAAEPYNTRK
jgi:hypothetical protein